MYYYNQRIPVPLQRIEFKHILSGLQKHSQSQDEINEKPLATRKNIKKPEVKFLQDLQRNEKHDQQVLQTTDTMWDDRILQKLEKLKKQPNEFFEKVPKDPITLMNSSKINKFFEIRIQLIYQKMKRKQQKFNCIVIIKRRCLKRFKRILKIIKLNIRGGSQRVIEQVSTLVQFYYICRCKKEKGSFRHKGQIYEIILYQKLFNKYEQIKNQQQTLTQQ